MTDETKDIALPEQGTIDDQGVCFFVAADDLLKRQQLEIAELCCQAQTRPWLDGYDLSRLVELVRPHVEDVDMVIIETGIFNREGGRRRSHPEAVKWISDLGSDYRVTRFPKDMTDTVCQALADELVIVANQQFR